MSYVDHFSRQAAAYARHRPRYPAALYDHLARLAPGLDLAWDCATGNGQAAVGLAAVFARVVATDASADQIYHAEPNPRVRYHVARAENVRPVGLVDRSVDLVTVAQAMHWLDHEKFYAEVMRVLVPGGILAVWGYYAAVVDPAIDPILARYGGELLAPFWPPQVELLHHGFRDLPFPFEEITAPPFAIVAEWTLDDVLGYLSSWSPNQRFIDANGRHPIDEIRAELADAWGTGARPIRWPLALRLGRWSGRGEN